MPHISVKLWPGKTEEQKATLAAQITRDLMEITNNSEESISITIEDIAPEIPVSAPIFSLICTRTQNVVAQSAIQAKAENRQLGRFSRDL